MEYCENCKEWARVLVFTYLDSVEHRCVSCNSILSVRKKLRKSRHPVYDEKTDEVYKP